ncbi:hypothetical protein P8452_38484 [Trifolium repens]|nr:hypothetical protein P8452_38484 [Trifolium repens]
MLKIGSNVSFTPAKKQMDQSIVGNSSFLPYFAVPLHPVRNRVECLLGCVNRQFQGTSYQGFKLRSQSHQGFHDFETVWKQSFFCQTITASTLQILSLVPDLFKWVEIDLKTVIINGGYS